MAALAFQAHANYGTWSIDFERYLGENSTIFNVHLPSFGANKVQFNAHFDW